MNTSCKFTFPLHFILKLPNKYSKHIIHHTKQIFFQQQQAFLPCTQQKIVDKQNNKIRIQELHDLIEFHNDQILICREEINSLTFPNHSIKPKYVYLEKCKIENCRGFLNNHGICGICNKITCLLCSTVDIAIDTHLCNPDDIESTKLIKKDTKPCPQCQTKIFKISGCDQMWCTQCHIAFSWKFGTLETKIHNPHYYQWMKENHVNTREINDIECGQEINHHFINDFTYVYENEFNKYENDELNAFLDYIRNLCRGVIHNREVEIFTLTLHLNYIENDNEHIRVGYLKNYFDENEFKKKIFMNFKKNNKFNQYLQIIQLNQTVITDIVYRILDYSKNSSGKYPHHFQNEIIAIQNYCNELLTEMSIIYKSVHKHFNMSNQFITKKN
jgi:hypothetical protein